MKIRSSHLRQAFTLIELLAVVAIMVAIATFLAPAVSTIMRGGVMTRAVYDVAGLLDLARTEAMSKNTYVWVGFANAQSNQNWQLQVVAMRSFDGTSSYRATSGTTAVTSSTNGTAISRVLRIDNVIAVDPTVTQIPNKSFGDTIKNLPNATYVMSNLCKTNPAFLAVSGSVVATQVIVFTPQGQVIAGGGMTDQTKFAPTNPYDDLVVLPLCKTVGLGLSPSDPTQAILQSEMDAAAVSIRGGNGQVQIYRPQ